MTRYRDLDSILDEIVTLPSLPHTLQKINDMFDDPNTQLSEVGHVISTDPSIALKTLRLINSAYYALPQKITSVEHAVVLLGSKVIRNLALTATVFETLRSDASLSMKHNIACGLAMECIIGSGKLAHPLKADEAFVFGLLHDVGKVIFAQFLSEEFEEATQFAAGKRISQYVAEQEIIGTDHAEMGAALAQKWKLPADLIQAIAGHHDLAKCDSDDARGLAASLAIADYICYAAGIPGQPQGVVVLSEDMWEHAELESGDIPPILDKFFEGLPAIEELFQLAN